MTPTPTKAGRVRRAEQLLEGARNDDVRCLAHGHTFDDGRREPVVVEKVDGKLEVWCRQCADHYDEKITFGEMDVCSAKTAAPRRTFDALRTLWPRQAVQTTRHSVQTATGGGADEAQDRNDSTRWPAMSTQQTLTGEEAQFEEM